jgi:hypothetical protein
VDLDHLAHRDGRGARHPLLRSDAGQGDSHGVLHAG